MLGKGENRVVLKQTRARPAEAGQENERSAGAGLGPRQFHAIATHEPMCTHDAGEPNPLERGKERQRVARFTMPIPTGSVSFVVQVPESLVDAFLKLPGVERLEDEDVGSGLQALVLVVLGRHRG